MIVKTIHILHVLCRRDSGTSLVDIPHPLHMQHITAFATMNRSNLNKLHLHLYSTHQAVPGLSVAVHVGATRQNMSTPCLRPQSYLPRAFHTEQQDIHPPNTRRISNGSLNES